MIDLMLPAFVSARWPARGAPTGRAAFRIPRCFGACRGGESWAGGFDDLGANYNQRGQESTGKTQGAEDVVAADEIRGVVNCAHVC